MYSVQHVATVGRWCIQYLQNLQSRTLLPGLFKTTLKNSTETERNIQAESRILPTCRITKLNTIKIVFS